MKIFLFCRNYFQKEYFFIQIIGNLYKSHMYIKVYKSKKSLSLFSDWNSMFFVPIEIKMKYKRTLKPDFVFFYLRWRCTGVGSSLFYNLWRCEISWIEFDRYFFSVVFWSIWICFKYFVIWIFLFIWFCYNFSSWFILMNFD